MLASKKRGYDRMAAAAGLKYEQKSPSAPGDREEDEKEEKKRLVSFSVVQPSAVVHIEAPDEPPASVFRLLEQKKQQKCLNSQDAVVLFDMLTTYRNHYKAKRQHKQRGTAASPSPVAVPRYSTMDVSKLLKRHKARREQDHQKYQQDLKKLTEKHQAEVKQLQEDYKSKLPQAIAFHRNVMDERRKKKLEEEERLKTLTPLLCHFCNDRRRSIYFQNCQHLACCTHPSCTRRLKAVDNAPRHVMVECPLCHQATRYHEVRLA